MNPVTSSGTGVTNPGSAMGGNSGLSSQSGGLGSNSLDLDRGDSDLTDKNVNLAGWLSNQNTSIDPNKKY